MALQTEITIGRNNTTIPGGYVRPSQIHWEKEKDGQLNVVVDEFLSAGDAAFIYHAAETEILQVTDPSGEDNTMQIERVVTQAWIEPPTPIRSELYTFPVDCRTENLPVELLNQILALPQEQQDSLCFALLKTLVYNRVKATPRYASSIDI